MGALGHAVDVSVHDASAGAFLLGRPALLDKPAVAPGADPPPPHFTSAPSASEPVAMIFFVNSSVILGFSIKKARARSLPCPICSSPYRNQEPLRVTSRCSTAKSSTSPGSEMPSSYIMSNSACLNGAATLFFLTRTRVRFPTTRRWSLMARMRRMSRRTEG